MKKIIFGIAFFALIAGFNLQATAQVMSGQQPQDGLYEDNGMIDKRPIPYPPLRKADIMWEKRIWRVIDMRQKLNQPFYYPIEPHNDWRSFMRVVMDGIKEGSITPYDISSTDEFLVPLNYQEIITRQIDTIHRTLKRSYPPYEEFDTVIYSEFDPTRVMRIRIKEDWFFDRQRSQMMFRIIGICPVMMKERDGEEFPEPLFWIWYPEAREVFAEALVFNRENQAERRSYDEIFQKRKFSSFVYKESNVHDRRISEYATGLDALLESERVKNELFEFEHDLWAF